MVNHRLYYFKCGHIIRGSECRFWDQEPCLQGLFGATHQGCGPGQDLGRYLLCLKMPLRLLGLEISWVLPFSPFVGLPISDSILPGFVKGGL